MKTFVWRVSQTVQRWLYPDIAIPLVTAAIVVVLLLMTFGR